MNASQLAAKMLDWESKRKELDALEGEIQAAMLELKRTQTVGAVKASYSAGPMLTIKLDGIESAALDVVAEHEGVAPEHLLRDLIRDAAISLVTGRPLRSPKHSTEEM